VAEARDPEERGRVEDVRPDDDLRAERERDQHREAEERPAPDRGEPTTKPADGSDRNCDDPVAIREVAELLLRAGRVHDRLGEEGEAADDQREARIFPCTESTPSRSGRSGSRRSRRPRATSARSDEHPEPEAEADRARAAGA
jgi:hypothetical protein